MSSDESLNMCNIVTHIDTFIIPDIVNIRHKIIDCIYFNKINKFVFITNQLNIIHMDRNNVIDTDYNNYIRILHRNSYTIHNIQMLQTKYVLILLLDSQLYYSYDGYTFKSALITNTSANDKNMYCKKIKYIKSFNDGNKIFAYGTNILLESNNGIDYSECTKFDEVHDVYYKCGTYNFIVSVQNDILLNDVINTYGLYIYSKINGIYLLERDLRQKDSISIYNVKCEHNIKNNSIIVNMDEIIKNEKSKYERCFYVNDIEYGYIDNNISINPLSITDYVKKGFIFDVYGSKRSKYDSVEIKIKNDDEYIKINDLNDIDMRIYKFMDNIKVIKLYCIYIDNYFEIICIYDKMGISHMTLRLNHCL